MTGDADVNAPLVIDPSDDPDDEVVSTYPPDALVAQIQRMPSDKLINRVTIGDISAADTCGNIASYRLSVREYGSGAWNAVTGGAQTIDPIALPTTPGKATFRMQPITLRAGAAYLFTISGNGSGCYSATLRTWAHGGAKLNGGPAAPSARCQPTDAAKQDYYDTFRMWHVQGQDDAVSCPGESMPTEFDPGMPTGWLLIRQLPGPYVATDTDPDPDCWSMAPGEGVAAVPWESNKYVCQVSSFLPPTGEVDDGWYWGRRASPSHGGAPRDTYLKLDLDKADLAARYKPSLYFDSSEKWRPLELENFFAESWGEGSAHKACRYEEPPEGGGEQWTCEPISNTTALAVSGSPDNPSTLSIDDGRHNEGGEDSYQSSDPACRVDGLLDCNGGPKSTLYWHVTDASGADSYRFIQYWAFYRYNSFDPESHEGDWEAFAVAPSADRPTSFDFASFSAHGHWYSYLRDTLQCDDLVYNSYEEWRCNRSGQKEGSRVRVFVANGSHANYPDTCSSNPPQAVCYQPREAPFPERGHDGGRAWGHNTLYWNAYSSDGLTPFPLGATDWTFWPGTWGAGGGPSSPGTQNLWNQSYERCDDSAEGCPCPLQSCDGDSAAQRTAAGPGTQTGGRAQGTRPPTPPTTGAPAEASFSAAQSRCGTWSGPGVLAAACNQTSLQGALRRRALGARGPLRLAVRRRGSSALGARSDSATGIAQILAQPLRAGDRVVLTARGSATVDLAVRGWGGGRLVDATFNDLQLTKGQRASVTALGRGPRFSMRLSQTGKKARRPTKTTGVRP